MNTAIVWLLITVSNGYYNMGSVTVIGNFPTKEACVQVQDHMPSDRVKSRCIQTTIIR